MKRLLYVAAALLGLLVLTMSLFFWWDNVTFVDRRIRQYTEIKGYTVLERDYNSGYWFAKLSISKADGAKLRERYPFRVGFNEAVLAGKAQPLVDVPVCPTCWFFYRKEGMYDYTIFVLGADEQHLTIYQSFPGITDP